MDNGENDETGDYQRQNQRRAADGPGLALGNADSFGYVDEGLSVFSYGTAHMPAPPS
ncbi:hypothetical protein SDC9_67614 [bioreactor metagenome]|uniref:Uncharacterized protein n=1 Tax=bioreactor metagenome TaxID=1076179 RepID=A0A644XZT4_9ZZZZ